MNGVQVLHDATPSVVIDDLHVQRIPSLPAEADAPLVIDPDAPLPLAVAGQALQPIRGRHSEIFDPDRTVQHPKLAQSHLLNVLRQAARATEPKNSFGLAASERSNHRAML